MFSYDSTILSPNLPLSLPYYLSHGGSAKETSLLWQGEWSHRALPLREEGGSIPSSPIELFLEKKATPYSCSGLNMPLEPKGTGTSLEGGYMLQTRLSGVK